MNVLYIEDNKNDAELVRRYIETQSHNLTVVNSIEDAYESIFGRTFDLLLVDVLINEKRAGYEFVRTLRDKGLSVPIIAITGLNTEFDRQQFENSGFDDILYKPYQIKDLAQIISQYS